MPRRFTSLAATVGTVLGLSVILLLSSLVVVFYEAHRLLEMEESVQRSTEAVSAVQQLHEDLQDMDLAYLRFAFVGDSLGVRDFGEAEERFVRSLAAVQQIGRKHPQLSAPWQELEKFAVEKQARLRERMNAPPQANAAAGLVATDRIRDAVLRLTGALRAERAALEHKVQRRILRAQYAFAALAIATATLVGAAFALLIQNQRRLQQLKDRLAIEATHDVLTELPNRRYLLDWLDRALSLARRRSEPLSVMYVDLDGFKTVNDLFGHAAGDAALRAAAQAMTDSTRGCDFVARVGGDEFVIIASGTQYVDQMGEIAARLTKSVQHLQLNGRPLGLGATIGIACFPRHGRTTEQLLQAADSAMYQGKRAGKGRWMFAQEAESKSTEPDDAGRLDPQS